MSSDRRKKKESALSQMTEWVYDEDSTYLKKSQNGESQESGKNMESDDKNSNTAARADNVAEKTSPSKTRDPNNPELHIPEKTKKYDNGYSVKARTEYDNQLKQLQSWCRLEAEKHYSQAYWFESTSFYMEIAAALLGSVSLSGVGVSVTEWISNGGAARIDSLWSRIGVVGFGGVIVAGILGFVGKGSDSLLPSFQKRSQEHTQNAFSWQHLKHEIKATRILLRNPQVNITEVDQKYREHAKTRKEVSEKVIVLTKKPEPDLKTVKEYENKYLDKWPVHEFFVPKGDHVSEELKAPVDNVTSTSWEIQC